MHTRGMLASAVDEEVQPLVPPDYETLWRDKRPTNYVYDIPRSLELYFASFDNFIIRLCQEYRGPVAYGFSMFWTTLTAVEISIIAAFVLYVLGVDDLATHLVFLTLALTVISQIPKRFLWRNRPWMSGVAIQMRRDRTSSFPSRAVTCAVVYTWAAYLCFNYSKNDSFLKFHWSLPIMATAAVIFTSYSRIYLGTHYPTDCIGGVIQGSIICVAGTGLFYLDFVKCPSCHDNHCYSDKVVISFSKLGNVNWEMLLGGTVLSFVIALLSVLPPLRLWSKSHYILGMLFPSLIFQLAFLCPDYSTSNSSLSRPKSPSVWAYVVGLVGGGGIMLLGMKVKRRPAVSILIFTVIYFTATIGLSSWRIDKNHQS